VPAGKSGRHFDSGRNGRRDTFGGGSFSDTVLKYRRLGNTVCATGVFEHLNDSAYVLFEFDLIYNFVFPP
jgi:hypothetical protein